MATKKRKTTTAIIAGVTALALLLGGTFAWQSINQTALNEASDVINPGGRLHDDFDGSNKDVYVENFADEDIFARIRLEEYFEIVLNYNTAGEKTENIIGSKNEDGSYKYEIYKFDDNANGDGTFNAAVSADGTSYWNWATGGDTIFMPTFNKNKDSLEADLNGNYVDAIGGISNRNDPNRAQYENYYEWSLDETKDGNAIYDIDANMADELAAAGVDISELIDGTAAADNYAGYVKLVSETHTAKSTGTAELISMADWLDMVEAAGEYNEADHGYYWVYDEDGWVYWSAPIGSGEATGLLLDGIELNDVMDDTWYYAINVVAQFVTAGDTGSVEDSTGFYDTANGTVPSGDALTLLEKIGINDTTPGVDEEEMQTLILTADGSNSITVASGASIKLEAEDGADLSSITVIDIDGDAYSDWTYDAETGVLVMYDAGYAPYTISDATGSYSGEVDFESSSYEDTVSLYTRIHDASTPEQADVSFVKPGQSYEVQVEIASEDMQSVPEGFDITTATPVLSFTGTPIEGEEFALDESHYTLGNWSAFESFNEGENYSGYRATATLTVSETVGYGTTIAIDSSITDYEDNFGSYADYIVSDFEVDMDDVIVDLYDPNGNKVADYTVQENTTYDIVVSLNYNDESIVIYSTNEACGAVSDRVDAVVGLQVYTHYPDANGDVYNFNIDETTGRLVVAKDVDPNAGWEEYGHDQYLDNLTISFMIGDLLIDSGLDSETHCYVYGERDAFFPDEESFYIDIMDYEYENYWDNLYVILNDGPKQIAIYSQLDHSIDLTDQVTFAIDGNTDANTKIENGYLILGDNETSGELTVTATIDGRGSGSRKVQIVYATVQVNGETLTDADSDGFLDFTDEGAGDYTFSLKEGTAATWSMENGLDNMSFDSSTGVLTVTAPEGGYESTAAGTIKATIEYSDTLTIEIMIDVMITIPATAQ